MESYATAQQVFVAGLIFARVAALVMVMPGLSDSAVPPRVRLSFALLLTLCLYPLLQGTMPALPTSTATLYGLIIRETLIGLMMGTILRLFMAALATAGEVIALQTTLAFAQTANPSEAQPTASLSTFLTLFGLTLLFSSGLHHDFLRALFGSYAVFSPGGGLPVTDAGVLAVQTTAKAFTLGIQLAAPVIVFALVFNVATGLIGRVMPQFQIFFVASPLSVLLGLSVFVLSLGAIGLTWTSHYHDLVAQFSPGG